MLENLPHFYTYSSLRLVSTIFIAIALIFILQDPCNTLLHTGPQDELEKTLLEKVVRVIDRHMKPAVLPMVKINVSI